MCIVNLGVHRIAGIQMFVVVVSAVFLFKQVHIPLN